VTVVDDDLLGAMLHIEARGVSVMPLVLAALTLFGIGGLFATRILGASGASAVLVALAAGLGGLAVAWLLFGAFRRPIPPDPSPSPALVGAVAHVIVGIPAGRSGRVIVGDGVDAREYPATASVDLAPGTVARVTEVDAGSLVVEPPPR